MKGLRRNLSKIDAVEASARAKGDRSYFANSTFGSCRWGVGESQDTCIRLWSDQLEHWKHRKLCAPVLNTVPKCSKTVAFQKLQDMAWTIWNSGGLRYLGTFDNPVAALKTVSCYEFARWAELLEGKESTTGLDYLAVSIFGGVTFAQDVEKVVINVPTLNSTSSIAALDIGEQSHVLRKIWKTLEVQQKVTNVSMGNSSQCRMWRLARLRNLVLLPRVASMCFWNALEHCFHCVPLKQLMTMQTVPDLGKIQRISWCLSVDSWRCIREADATSDLSCVQ